MARGSILPRQTVQQRSRVATTRPRPAQSRRRSLWFIGEALVTGSWRYTQTRLHFRDRFELFPLFPQLARLDFGAPAPGRAPGRIVLLVAAEPAAYFAMSRWAVDRRLVWAKSE